MACKHQLLWIRTDTFIMGLGLLFCLSIATGVCAAENPVPLINQPLVPEAIKPGAPAFTLTVNGTGFVLGSSVRWNGVSLASTFVNASCLTASVPANKVAHPGTAAVTVVNPGPGGGTSNTAFLAIAPSSSLLAVGAPGALPAGSLPFAVAVGDFNSDGKLDLAVVNSGSNNVSIFLGRGDGTFQAAVDYATGPQPSSVAVGDFNGDGKLDLAVANQNCGSSPCGAGSVSILLGKGDGTFEAAVEYSSETAPYSVAVGDFNRDGKLDLAIANNEGGLGVMLGEGDGTFESAVYYSTGSGTAPAAVAVGDFNHDGNLDLAVANFGCGTPCGNLAILLGNGDGTFRPAVNYAVGAQPISIAVGDFNRDGNLDLAVANISSSNVSVLLGNGDGTFKTAMNYGVSSDAVSVAIGDFNGDGKPDLAVALLYNSAVTVFLGNGDGTFGAGVSYAAGSGPNSIALGDFNGDGRLDLAVADSTSTSVSILLQTPTVSLSKTSLMFPSQLLGTTSPSQTITLSNPSGLMLKGISIALTGPDKSDFDESNTCGSSRPAGGICTISLTFSPTKLGPRTASVSIADNAASSPQTIVLNGTGIVSGPDATLSPKTSSFPVQLAGTTSSPQSVTLSNYGTAALAINRIAITGSNSGDFDQTHTCGTSIAAGAKCTISVSFKPARGGSRTASVSVTDNAPRSPQTATLSGTGTIVKLAPTSLSFTCHDDPKTCPPPPQGVTLTNVGTMSLSISSITITGSTAFSQKHNCGLSVGAKKSCTITVTFNSSTRGTFAGALSISDNGGGSPQQVALSGRHSKTSSTGVAVRSALKATRATAVPSPTGPNSVGTQLMTLVDKTRPDPFLGDGTWRELLVRFWYPAASGQACQPAEYTSPLVWSYFSQLAGVSLPEVKSNSCLNAFIANGIHPVLVFTPGYTGTFTDYTFLLEDLASRGYVVAAIDHTYEATAVAFPDGRFVASVFGSHLVADTLRSDEEALSLANQVRLDDLKFVRDELDKLNVQADSPFAAKLDLSRVAVAGHSLGGLSAWLGLERDPRLEAAVLIDASLSDGPFKVTNKPVLILGMGRDQWTSRECGLWGELRGQRLAVNLQGMEHLTPTDAVWLAKGAIKTGRMDPQGAIAAIRDYVASFLDTTLRDKRIDPLLPGLSLRYRDAIVTLQPQSLCSGTLKR